VIRENWELTEEARTTLREIYLSDTDLHKGLEILWRRQRQFGKKHGRLGEVITAIREDFIRETFQWRVERGVVSKYREEEAKALLDELRDELRRRATIRREANTEAGLEEDDVNSKLSEQFNSETTYLPTIKTVMDVIEKPYSENWKTEYEANKIQERNFRNTLKVYQDIMRDLGLFPDLFKDRPWS
jgi:hypothetical protein